MGQLWSYQLWIKGLMRLQLLQLLRKNDEHDVLLLFLGLSYAGPDLCVFSLGVGVEHGDDEVKQDGRADNQA